MKQGNAIDMTVQGVKLEEVKSLRYAVPELSSQRMEEIRPHLQAD